MSFNLEIRLKKAQKAFSAGQFSEAREHYQQVLERFPQNTRAQKGYLLCQSAIADANFQAHHPPMQELNRIAGLLSHGGAEEAARLPMIWRHGFQTRMLCSTFLAWRRRPAVRTMLSGPSDAPFT